MRLALFGGSFDPPHVGHLLAMAWVLGTARVDGLLMVPCFRHRFDKRLSPFDDRLEMARRTAAVLGGRVEVSEVSDGMALLARGPAPGTRIVVVGAAELFSTEFGGTSH